MNQVLLGAVVVSKDSSRVGGVRLASSFASHSGVAVHHEGTKSTKGTKAWALALSHDVMVRQLRYTALSDQVFLSQYTRWHSARNFGSGD